MSSRDELREALKSSLKANLHISYVIVDGHCSHGITRWDKAMDAVLAVLDQRGWPQDEASDDGDDFCRACQGTITRHTCPTGNAAEPVPLVGTASLLGTPLPRMPGARRVPAEPGVDLSDPNDHGLLGGLAMTDTYNPSHPHEPAISPTFDAEGRCLVCGLLVRCEEAQTERDAALRTLVEADNHHNAGACPYCTHNGEFVLVEASELAALREAARYEQVGWLIPESECGDGVDPGNAVVSPDKYYGDERDVPLYRRVTTAGED